MAKSPEKLLKSIGKQIRRKRLFYNLSQKDIAELINTSPNTISRFETGTYEPNINQFLELCRILKINPGQFKNGNEQNE